MLFGVRRQHWLAGLRKEARRISASNVYYVKCYRVPLAGASSVLGITSRMLRCRGHLGAACACCAVEATWARPAEGGTVPRPPVGRPMIQARTEQISHTPTHKLPVIATGAHQFPEFKQVRQAQPRKT